MRSGVTPDRCRRGRRHAPVVSFSPPECIGLARTPGRRWRDAAPPEPIQSRRSQEETMGKAVDGDAEAVGVSSTDRRAGRALFALLDLSKALSSEVDLDALLRVIVEKASNVVEAER